MAKGSKKSKSEANSSGVKYRTADHFKASIFGKSKFNPGKGKGQGFTNTPFRTQHKG